MLGQTQGQHSAARWGRARRPACLRAIRVDLPEGRQRADVRAERERDRAHAGDREARGLRRRGKGSGQSRVARGFVTGENARVDRTGCRPDRVCDRIDRGGVRARVPAPSRLPTRGSRAHPERLFAREATPQRRDGRGAPSRVCLCRAFLRCFNKGCYQSPNEDAIADTCLSPARPSEKSEVGPHVRFVIAHRDAARGGGDPPGAHPRRDSRPGLFRMSRVSAGPPGGARGAVTGR